MDEKKIDDFLDSVSCDNYKDKIKECENKIMKDIATSVLGLFLFLAFLSFILFTTNDGEGEGTYIVAVLIFLAIPGFLLYSKFFIAGEDISKQSYRLNILRKNAHLYLTSEEAKKVTLCRIGKIFAQVVVYSIILLAVIQLVTNTNFIASLFPEPSTHIYSYSTRKNYYPSSNKSYSKSSTSTATSSSQSKSGTSTKSKSSTKKKKYPDDPYDVYDYEDPEEFYYFNYDDFIDFEDAEDYFEEHWDNY